MMWETFCDESYYGLWAVRKQGDRSFNSRQLFHVQGMEEAEALKNLLNDLVTTATAAQQGVYSNTLP